MKVTLVSRYYDTNTMPLCPYQGDARFGIQTPQETVIGPSISKSIVAPLFVKMACKQNLDLGCVLISDPGILGAGAKTRLHTPKAVTYHEQPDYCRFMIGHSLGRMESRNKEVYATLCLQAKILFEE